MTRKSAPGRAGAFALAFAAPATPAAAHATFKGIGTFYNYMFHPFSVPAHMMVLIAVGLMLGQQRRRIGGLGLRAVAAGLGVGLSFDAAAGNETLPETSLLVVAALLGAAVSLGRSAPSVLAMLGAGLAGLVVGLDSAPGIANKYTSALAYAGLVFGVMWIVTIVSGYTVDLTKNWQSIGKRVVGSWIVAASLLVLTLSLHPPAKQSIAAVQSNALHDQ